MALKAGRVGVAPKEVDAFGNIIGGGSGGGYTKEEADAKFQTKTEADAKFQTKADALKVGTIVPTINNDFYIYTGTSTNDTLHDDGDDITSFVFDCGDHIGGVLNINVVPLTSSGINRFGVGCVDKIEEGALVDTSIKEYSINELPFVSWALPVTKRYVVVYVRNSKLTNAQIKASGVLIY